MKQVKGFMPMVVIGLVMLCLATPLTAHAHRMFLTYEPSEIEVLAAFEGGSVAREADVAVYLPDGTVFVEGKTDQDGKFRFAPGDMEGELRISASHSGHRATVALGSVETASGDGLGLPLISRMAAGFGYLIGAFGIALLLVNQRRQGRRASDRVSED